MRPVSALARHSRPALRVVAFVLLCGALLAPKVSLALAHAFGNGYRSVVICTGGGLARVTVSPDGSTVDDVSERWSASHCVLPDRASADLERAWRRTGWPPFTAVGSVTDADALPAPRAVRPASSSRGPPRA